MYNTSHISPRDMHSIDDCNQCFHVNGAGAVPLLDEDSDVGAGASEDGVT